MRTLDANFVIELQYTDDEGEIYNNTLYAYGYASGTQEYGDTGIDVHNFSFTLKTVTDEGVSDTTFNEFKNEGFNIILFDNDSKVHYNPQTEDDLYNYLFSFVKESADWSEVWTKSMKGQ